MSEVIRFEEDRFLRNHAVNQTKCICIVRSWHTEVCLLMEKRQDIRKKVAYREEIATYKEVEIHEVYIAE